MAELVRTRQVSPVELVEKSIAHLEIVNPYLNAMAENMFSEARGEARDLENKIFSNPEAYAHLPLLGVPVTIKEMFAVKNKKRTAGNINYKNDIMDFDSTLVARLRGAGAIPICTTNVPELGLWFETENVIYGRTKNPFDLNRTSGGSTGGDAALVAGLVTPIGIGSDIGGSVRIPAGFCGIYGHKPTWRKLPKTGHFPSTEESIKQVTKETDTITTMGFLAREIEDLPLLMEVLSGPDGKDPLVDSAWKKSETPRLNPKNNKIYILPNPKLKLNGNADKEVSDKVLEAARRLISRGFQVEELPQDYFYDAFEIWSAVTSVNKTSSFYDKMTRGHNISLFVELFKYLVGKPNYTFPALITCVMELFKNTEKMKEGLEKAKVLEKKLLSLLGTENILIMPTHARVAPRHQFPYLRPFDFCMTGCLNPFGIPATAVPVGLNPKGLPLSLQVAAGLDQDQLNFEMAELLTLEFGGFKKPKFTWSEALSEEF